MNFTTKALKLKVQLENLERAPTLDNANALLKQIQQMKDENFQIVQNVLLTTLLNLMDESDGL